MAGTIPLSMTQQFDEFGEPLAGGQLYIYQAGTVATPQNPYQDTALSIVMPNPITLDAAGRIPQFFLADGFIKIRLQDVNGVVQLAADGILVIGPSAGGGGGGGVDPTTILATGDMKVRYDNVVINGFVRANGRTIGSAASTAVELASATAQALFNFLWVTDTSLVVLPSRGVSGAADWATNKTIALPDFRGYALSALDDMGNTPANRLTAAGFGTSAIVLGAVGGTETRTIGVTQLPAHQHNVYLHDPTHAHGSNANIQNNALGAAASAPFTVSTAAAATINAASTGVTIGSVPGVASDNLTTNVGSGAALPAIGPRKLVTFYLKL